MVQLVEQLPSLYHCASGCRLARLGLRVMVALRVADPPSEAKTGPNFSTKVMLILVYSILGSMAAKAETEGKGQKERVVHLTGCECLLLHALNNVGSPSCSFVCRCKNCAGIFCMCVLLTCKRQPSVRAGLLLLSVPCTSERERSFVLKTIIIIML